LLSREWRLIEGPEWGSARAGADPWDEYFDENLEAIFHLLRRDPYRCSHAFLGDARADERVVQTTDQAAGYRVIVFVRIVPSEKHVELGWVELETLD